MSVIVDDGFSFDSFRAHHKTGRPVWTKARDGSDDAFLRNIHRKQALTGGDCGWRLNPGAPRRACGGERECA
jgi:hypothetical protein